MASRMFSNDGYFPVPTIRRDLNSLPPSHNDVSYMSALPMKIRGVQDEAPATSCCYQLPPIGGTRPRGPAPHLGPARSVGPAPTFGNEIVRHQPPPIGRTISILSPSEITD